MKSAMWLSMSAFMSILQIIKITYRSRAGDDRKKVFAGAKMIMVFAGANFKSTLGAVLIKIFKFCFYRQIPNSQDLFLEKKN